MKLVSIPPEKYHRYKLDEMFNGYKWDPQWIDNNTVARYALVITENEAKEIEELTEKLSAETIAAENVLKDKLHLCKSLALNGQISRALKKIKDYDASKHIRLMRFDFHPVVGGGYAVSEVNSDVPGGFAESSIMPLHAAALLPENNYYLYRDFGSELANAIAAKTKKDGRVALIHCTCYSDDRQHMQFLGDKLLSLGLRVVYCAADHIKFENRKAVCLLDGNTGAVDSLVRFTPLEWLKGLPKAWHGYFDTVTPSCNHPVAMFAQTKRFPFLWDSLEKLGVDLTEWKKLLPETVEPREAGEREGFIYKPACGRVGEGISIKGTMPENEYNKILKDAKRHPKRYVAQKMFHSLPVTADDGKEFHVCFGSYSVEGMPAGFYSRISSMARIDSGACDIPVLTERSAE